MRNMGSSLWRDAWLRLLSRNRLALAGFAVLTLFVLVAMLTPWIAPYDYAQQNLELGAAPPYGRPLAGHRYLRPGPTDPNHVRRPHIAWQWALSPRPSHCSSVWAGALSPDTREDGSDAVMMRLVDILYALPFMIFIVLLMVVFGRNLLLLFLAIGAVEWLTMARIMRAQVQSLRQQEFVEAAVSLGLSPSGQSSGGT